MICVESEFHGGLVPTSPDEALTLWPLPPPQAPPSQQLPGETCSQRAQSTAHTASTEHVTYMNMHKKHTEALYTLLPHTQPHNHTGEPGARGRGICVVMGEQRGGSWSFYKVSDSNAVRTKFYLFIAPISTGRVLPAAVVLRWILWQL